MTYVSDSGALRAVLTHHDTLHVGRVYNDLNKKTNKRRLKVETWNLRGLMNSPRVWKKVQAELQTIYGSRFVKATLGESTMPWCRYPQLCVYLDDNKGAPPVRPVNPNPKKLPLPAYAFKDPQAHFDFWNSAVTKPLPPYQRYTGTLRALRTTSRDVCVFKKVYAGRSGANVIANLIIPKGTQVFITGNKCRASRARVHSLAKLSSGKPVQEAHSAHDPAFLYMVGNTVKPFNPFDRSLSQCTSGIHFFIDIGAAARY